MIISFTTLYKIISFMRVKITKSISFLLLNGHMSLM